MTLRFSLTAFGLEPDEYVPVALAAEREGFEVMWLGDHLISPVDYGSSYPYSPTGGPGHAVETPMLDVWVNIARLAAQTTTLRFGSGVLILPLRSPFVTARAAASAQIVSDGRVILGVGAGWLREEFDAVGEPFDGRGRRCDEAIGILRRLWTGEVVEHDGDAYSFGPVRFVPAPPPIPIVVGGISKPAIRRAARLGDGWFGPSCSLEEAVAARDAIAAERVAAGRDHLPFTTWARIDVPVDRDQVRRFADAGFDRVAITGAKLAGPGDPPGARLDALARAAETLRAAAG